MQVFNKEDVVKHKKTGNFYKVINVGLVKTKFLWFKRWKVSIVYTRLDQQDKTWYVRKLKDFENKFERV